MSLSRKEKDRKETRESQDFQYDIAVQNVRILIDELVKSYYKYDDENVCAILCQLGKLYQRGGSYDIAMSYYKADCNLSYTLDKIYGLATGLCNLSSNCLDFYDEQINLNRHIDNNDHENSSYSGDVNINDDFPIEYLTCAYYTALFAVMIKTGMLTNLLMPKDIPCQIKELPERLRQNYILQYLNDTQFSNKNQLPGQHFIDIKIHDNGAMCLYALQSFITAAAYMLLNQHEYQSYTIIQQFYNVVKFYIRMLEANKSIYSMSKLSPKHVMTSLLTTLDVFKSLKLVKYNPQLIRKILNILNMYEEFDDCQSMVYDIEYYKSFYEMILNSKVIQLSYDIIKHLCKQDKQGYDRLADYAENLLYQSVAAFDEFCQKVISYKQRFKNMFLDIKQAYDKQQHNTPIADEKSIYKLLILEKMPRLQSVYSALGLVLPNDNSQPEQFQELSSRLTDEEIDVLFTPENLNALQNSYFNATYNGEHLLNIMLNLLLVLIKVKPDAEALLDQQLNFIDKFIKEIDEAYARDVFKFTNDEEKAQFDRKILKIKEYIGYEQDEVLVFLTLEPYFDLDQMLLDNNHIKYKRQRKIDDDLSQQNSHKRIDNNSIKQDQLFEKPHKQVLSKIKQNTIKSIYDQKNDKCSQLAKDNFINIGDLSDQYSDESSLSSSSSDYQNNIQSAPIINLENNNSLLQINQSIKQHHIKLQKNTKDNLSIFDLKVDKYISNNIGKQVTSQYVSKNQQLSVQKKQTDSNNRSKQLNIETQVIGKQQSENLVIKYSNVYLTIQKLQQQITSNTHYIQIEKCNIGIQQCLMCILTKIIDAEHIFLQFLNSYISDSIVEHAYKDVTLKYVDVLDLSYNNFIKLKFSTKFKQNTLYIKQLILCDTKNSGNLFVQLLNLYEKIDIKLLQLSISTPLNDIDFSGRIQIEKLYIKQIFEEDETLIEMLKETLTYQSTGIDSKFIQIYEGNCIVSTSK